MIVAVLLKEPGHEAVLEHLTSDHVIRIGAPTLAETSMVLVARAGIVGRTVLARLLEETEAEVIDFTDEHYDSSASLI